MKKLRINFKRKRISERQKTDISRVKVSDKLRFSEI